MNFNRRWTRKLSPFQKTGILNYILRQNGILRAKCFDQFLKGRFITATSKVYVASAPWSIRATRALSSVYTSAWFHDFETTSKSMRFGSVYTERFVMMVKARPHFAPNSISLTIGCTIWEIPSSCGHPRPYSKKSHQYFHGKSSTDNGKGGWLSLKWWYLPNNFVHDCSSPKW